MNDYVNKVIYGTSTLIDLTNDTVTPETLQSGVTAHDASGASIVGTSDIPSIIAYPFSESITYNIGDYVTYNGDFYCFTSTHDAGIWNSSDVLKITVAEELNKKLSLSGGTMEGTIKFAENGYMTSDILGYQTDKYGNFIHSSSTTTNSWNIKNYNKTSIFSINTETGKIYNGIWNAMPIDIQYGGTGASTSTNALANLGALPLTGGTMTGSPTVKKAKSTAFYVGQANDYGYLENLPTENNAWYDSIVFYDKNQKRIGDWRNVIKTDGGISVEIGAARSNSDNTTTWNTLTFNINPDKTRSISVNDAAAWRNGIGAAASNHTHNYAGSASAGGPATSLVNFTSTNSTAYNANEVNSNALVYYNSNGPATSLGAQATNGALYSQAYSTNWVAQIAQDYRTGNLFTRGKNNGTWQPWKAVSYVNFVGVNDTSTALDNMKTPGFYFVEGNSGIPIGSNGMLFVFQFDSNRYLQVFFRYGTLSVNDNVIVWRKNNGSSWGSWWKVTGTTL